MSDLGVEIDSIVEEVKKAIRAVQDDQGPPAVAIQNVELELTTFLEREAGGEFKVKVPFTDVKIGVGGKLAATETQTITLVLAPGPPRPPMQRMMGERINEALASAIRAIRSSVVAAASTPPAFHLDEGAVSLKFGVTKEGTVDVVVEGGANRETTHTITLHLTGAAAAG